MKAASAYNTTCQCICVSPWIRERRGSGEGRGGESSVCRKEDGGA